MEISEECPFSHPLFSTEMFAQAGLQAVAQTSHRAPAPLLLNEAVATELVPASTVPAHHFRIEDAQHGREPRASAGLSADD